MRHAKALLTHGQHYEHMLTDGDNAVEWNGTQYDLDALSWAPPIKGTVYGTLFNFKGEVTEIDFNKAPYQKPPEHVVMYIKPANTINQHMGAIPLPEGIDEVQARAALGIVIGKTMSQVPEHDVFDYVAGYTVVNDVTVPHDSYFRPDIKNKTRDGFCPVGPWIMERSEIENPDDLEIHVYVNEERVQTNHTGNHIRPVSKLLADITAFMTLSPGDVVLTGTPENPRL
ncbi:4-hydroxyphenylacetate degradation bifunctional isomerase/decarboxylase [Lentibacillus sp. JNUCC-1]|uniref:fumarylacetoacetate hydrolase family protein n=1 Tax=Lentibacillus sp. JNUCC-1 TaxID=2654513 RepID=UPI0012E963BF|nr:fumarylacetoacetate hydrolase family protein [Lentibacillus sp. JNUCC-1]MUV39000.1 4-hydroxyphenylacetate degradation bifunctional isomerase/decarboxylase [Lentibacillus sp. JNUCC-1]